MKRYLAIIVLLAAVAGLAFSTTYASTPNDLSAAFAKMITPPAPPALFTAQLEAKENAPLYVAAVWGRSEGCRTASPAMIHEVADAALQAGVSPKVFAATIAIESGCNPHAISTKGAVGLTQVNVKVWAAKYDFATINLLNEQENLKVGGAIMAGYIRQWGERDGLRRYNGTGIGCESCDAGYTDKIEVLANGR